MPLLYMREMFLEFALRSASEEERVLEPWPWLATKVRVGREGLVDCFLSAVLDPGAIGFSERGHGGAASSSAGGVLSEDAASICARGVFLNLFLSKRVEERGFISVDKSARQEQTSQ